MSPNFCTNPDCVDTREALNEDRFSLELEREAAGRARKMYMEKHGIEYWPDTAVTSVWLLEHIDELHAENDRLKQLAQNLEVSTFTRGDTAGVVERKND